LLALTSTDVLAAFTLQRDKRRCQPILSLFSNLFLELILDMLKDPVPLGKSGLMNGVIL
jgi:hypothetical protein